MNVKINRPSRFLEGHGDLGNQIRKIRRANQDSTSSGPNNPVLGEIKRYVEPGLRGIYAALTGLGKELHQLNNRVDCIENLKASQIRQAPDDQPLGKLLARRDSEQLTVPAAAV